jgi:hypothetical protein
LHLVAQQQKRQKQVRPMHPCRLGLLSSSAHRLVLQHITAGAGTADADTKAGAAHALISASKQLLLVTCMSADYDAAKHVQSMQYAGRPQE